jgi:hypothetical protein
MLIERNAKQRDRIRTIWASCWEDARRRQRRRQRRAWGYIHFCDTIFLVVHHLKRHPRSPASAPRHGRCVRHSGHPRHHRSIGAHATTKAVSEKPLRVHFIIHVEGSGRGGMMFRFVSGWVRNSHLAADHRALRQVKVVVGVRALGIRLVPAVTNTRSLALASPTDVRSHSCGVSGAQRKTPTSTAIALCLTR